jgi:hypothetical protein
MNRRLAAALLAAALPDAWRRSLRRMVVALRREVVQSSYLQPIEELCLKRAMQRATSGKGRLP